MNATLSIVSILVVAILLVAIAMLFIGGGKKKIEANEEDEKIFDPVTGKMVDVDELIDTHQLEMVTDEMVDRVYSGIPEELRGDLLPRDVSTILEAHFQSRSSPGLDYDPAELAIVLSETYQVKGRRVSENQIAWILSAV